MWRCWSSIAWKWRSKLSNEEQSQIRKVFSDEESLKILLANLRKFEREFCTMMYEGADFTVKMEVRGSNGEMELCKVSTDTFSRPLGMKKKSGK
jgi:hypothetical protein